MISTETVEIGDHEYRITQLGAREGRRILVKVAGILGPALSRLMESDKRGTSLENVGIVVSELSLNLTDSDLHDLCKTFGENTNVIVAGVPKLLDLTFQELHFAGEYHNMFAWLGHCLKVNFGGFISALGELGSEDLTIPEQAKE